MSLKNNVSFQIEQQFSEELFITIYPEDLINICKSKSKCKIIYNNFIKNNPCDSYKLVKYSIVKSNGAIIFTDRKVIKEYDYELAKDKVL